MAGRSARHGVESPMTAAILLLGLVLGCIAVVLSPLPTSEIVNPESSRAQWMRRAQARLGVTIGVLSMLSFATLFAWSLGLDWPLWPFIAASLFAVALIHPWSIVRWICIPLGMSSAAHRIARLGGQPWVRDPVGGAVLSGALASLRSRVPATDQDAWLRMQLGPAPLRGAGIVAAGLIAANAGDRNRARRLLASLDQLDPDLCPALARGIAADWLVADAAVRGAWDEVAEHVDTLPDPSRSARFIAIAAERLRGEYVSDGALIKRWLLAPRRLHTLSLLRRALRATDLAEPAPIPHDVSEVGGLSVLRSGADLGELAANDGGAAPTRALSLHAETVASEAVPSEQLDRLGDAWEVALQDFPFRGRVRERALELGCGTSPELLMAEFRRDVSDDIADVVIASRSDTRDFPRHERRVLGRAVIRVRQRLLARVRQACAAMARHRTSANANAAIDVWTSWLEVCRCHADAVTIGGPSMRTGAYATLEPQMRAMAAWLWNQRGEKGLANAISAWLMLEAERADDQASATYHRNNVALVI